MTRTHLFYILLMLSSLLISCEDDGATMPPYRQDLAELRTTPDGVATTLWLDDGSSHQLLTPIHQLTADSVYRVFAAYTETTEGLSLTHCQLVHAPFAKVYPENQLVRNPLSVVAAWKTARYVNLQLHFKSKFDARHAIGFHHEKTTVHPDGKTTIGLTLVHNDNNTEQLYTRETYVSCPLYNFAASDTVTISITTFEGDVTYTLF